jgi:hypothetical protein
VLDLPETKSGDNLGPTALIKETLLEEAVGV